MLLKPPETLADLARADRADAVDRLELALGGPDDALETFELGDEPLDHVLGEPWDVREHPIAARRDRVVEGIRRGRKAQHCEELELEQVLVRDLGEDVEALACALDAALGVVVVDDGGLVRWNLADELLSLAADRDLPRLDEKLFLDAFNQQPRPAKAAAKRR